MPLTSGVRLGSYEIVSAIGAGGMGEVYRARDTSLNRDVAIKILPELFAGDPERLARFSREAQTLAALNHPNIAHVYGLEGSGLVMELVDGEELAQRLARGPLPLVEDFDVARDGRFLVLKGLPQKPPIPHVIVNWFDVLKRTAPVGGREHSSP